MPFLDNHSVLNLLSTLAKGLGQFPAIHVTKDHGPNGPKVKYVSWAGLWTVILLALHGICSQTIYVQIHSELMGASAKLAGTIQLVLAFVQLALALQCYVMYGAWLWLLSRYLKCWTLIVEYDTRYRVGVGVASSGRHGRPLWTNIKYLTAYCVPWALGCGLSILSRLDMMLVFRSNQFTYSWLNRVVGNSVVTAWTVAISVLIQDSASFIAMAFTSFMAKIVCDKLREVNQEVQSGDTQGAATKLESLIDIHRALSEASEWIIFGSMTFGTVIIALLVFLVLNVWNSIEYENVVLGMCAIALSLFWKMMVLCNAGEYLDAEVKELRLVIMRTKVGPSTSKCVQKLPSPASIDKSAWSRSQNAGLELQSQEKELRHLKDLASVLDFGLSGCGFLNVNRHVITSIVSAVITYNIVLVQFQDSDNAAAAGSSGKRQKQP